MVSQWWIERSDDNIVLEGAYEVEGKKADLLCYTGDIPILFVEVEGPVGWEDKLQSLEMYINNPEQPFQQAFILVYDYGQR